MNQQKMFRKVVSANPGFYESIQKPKFKKHSEYDDALDMQEKLNQDALIYKSSVHYTDDIGTPVASVDSKKELKEQTSEQLIEAEERPLKTVQSQFRNA